jgi:hypothetical protein
MLYREALVAGSLKILTAMTAMAGHDGHDRP